MDLELEGSTLADGLGAILGASVTVESARRLTGGASRESWDVQAKVDGARHHLVIRRDPPTAPRPERLEMELQLMHAARDVGVPVPEVVGADLSGACLGAPCLVMEHVGGESRPKHILVEDRFAGLRQKLAGRLGEIAGRIQSIRPSEVPTLTAFDRLDEVRTEYEEIGVPVPVFTYAFRWLEGHRPPLAPDVVVHGDFRNGNLLVDESDVRAVLDWEAARLGDPAEDLAWLCVRAWRFGGPGEVGGFGHVQDLLAGYEDATGRWIDRRRLEWWMTLGTLRWGVGCLRQLGRYRRHEVRTVEMALIGRRTSENEHDLVGLLRRMIDGAP